MNSNFVVKLALSAAFVAVPTLGCTSLGISSTSKVSAAKAGPEKAYGWARKAEKAFAKGKTDRALTFAELAVEADMQNRDYRGLLARIYMSQGRFASAERTLMDVMELGQVDPRTVISLALSRIAQGEVDSAVALVEANRSIVPASDYGLTLALAGQSGRAVEVLSDAIRADNSSARTRQNLALAYALDGRWREARIMAVQDMTQEKVNDRIAEWAQYARPGAYQTRVAGLLNVTPRADDAGQPVRLALNSVPSGMAQAAVEAPVAMVAAAPTAELAAIGPAPIADSAGFAAVETAVRMAEVEPVEAPLIKAQEAPAKAVVFTPLPVKLALADAPASAPAKVSGTHLVQLGAFSSTANAEKAWSQYSKRFGVLNGLSSTSSNVSVNGKTLVRLAAAGFGNQASANAACQQIKSMGGACIVRSVNGGQPARLASNQGRRIAAR
ncbi:MAG: SPOR domain-containing protein [Sphingorhabdus sp.]